MAYAYRPVGDQSGVVGEAERRVLWGDYGFLDQAMKTADVGNPCVH